MSNEIDEELEYEINQMDFDAWELNSECDECGHYDEIDSEGNVWTILDYKTFLCKNCFRSQKKEILCNCVNGCNECLMTSY